MALTNFLRSLDLSLQSRSTLVDDLELGEMAIENPHNLGDLVTIMSVPDRSSHSRILELSYRIIGSAVLAYH